MSVAAYMSVALTAVSIVVEIVCRVRRLLRPARAGGSSSASSCCSYAASGGLHDFRNRLSVRILSRVPT